MKIYYVAEHPKVLSTLQKIAEQKGYLGENQTALQELEFVLGKF